MSATLAPPKHADAIASGMKAFSEPVFVVTGASVPAVRCGAQRRTAIEPGASDPDGAPDCQLGQEPESSTE